MGYRTEWPEDNELPPNLQQWLKDELLAGRCGIMVVNNQGKLVQIITNKIKLRDFLPAPGLRWTGRKSRSLLRLRYQELWE